MKRSRFIGTSAAAALAGCGGGAGHVVPAARAVSGGASAGVSGPADLDAQRAKSSVQWVPEKADPIPASTLTHPIVGEGARWDGASIPAGWILAKGQNLRVADYPRLFSVLGTSAGGDGRVFFKLPQPSVGYIVAAAGTLPSNPSALAQLRRGFTDRAMSLGPGARGGTARVARVLNRQAFVQQPLLPAPVAFSSRAPDPMTADESARIGTARSDAHFAALARLGPASSERLRAAIDAAVSGRATLNDAVVTMSQTLSPAEAGGLLAVSDAMKRPFATRGLPGHANVNLEAAHFLLSIAVSREQAEAIGAHEI